MGSREVGDGTVWTSLWKQLPAATIDNDLIKSLANSGCCSEVFCTNDDRKREDMTLQEEQGRKETIALLLPAHKVGLHSLATASARFTVGGCSVRGRRCTCEFCFLTTLLPQHAVSQNKWNASVHTSPPGLEIVTS